MSLPLDFGPPVQQQPWQFRIPQFEPPIQATGGPLNVSVQPPPQIPPGFGWRDFRPMPMQHPGNMGNGMGWRHHMGGHHSGGFDPGDRGWQGGFQVPGGRGIHAPPMQLPPPSPSAMFGARGGWRNL